MKFSVLFLKEKTMKKLMYLLFALSLVAGTTALVYSVKEDPDPSYKGEDPDPSYKGEDPDPSYKGEDPDPSYKGEDPDPSYKGEDPDPSYK
jgi:hypothetical protein